ncbi:MAG TPA: hypothetical protein VHE60_19340 [Pyrinomonadaceae bacterium]|nr:hypothetical protein [Pyrinomonadaceae bacterium]
MSKTLRNRFLLLLLLLAAFRVEGGAAQQNNPEGFLKTSTGEVMFIQLTQLRGRLSGQMQIISLEGRYKKETKAQSASFSGVINGSQLSLVFKGFLTERTIVGTLSRSKLTLSLPQANGKISVAVFSRASIRQYNMAVAQLEHQAAIANREIEQRNYEENINSNIARALGALAEQIKQSKGRNGFDKEVESFREHWATMQQHAHEFESKLDAINEARYALSNLTYDRSNIRYDRSSLDYQTKSALEEVASVQRSMSEVGKAWSELQAAILRDKRGAIRRDVSQELITKFQQTAMSEIYRVEALIRKANGEATEFERKADDLLTKSKDSFERARKKNPQL